MKQVSVLILITFMHLTAASQNTYTLELNKITSQNILVIPTANEEIAIWTANELALHKFDKCGNSLWNKQFSFPNFTSSCIQNEMIATINGGYAFMTRETTGTIISSRVTVLDALGNIVWSKVYSVPSYTICSYSLMEDSFGNFFIFGSINPLGGGNTYNLLIKLQANGNQLWSKFYTNGGIWGQAITTSDNGILLRTGFRLIKLNSLGNVQWTSQIWGPNFYYHFAPVEVSDGYIFTTTTDMTNSINFLKIDKSGNQLWGGAKTLNYEGINRKLLKKANGNILSVFNKTIKGKNLPTIIELDKDLNVVKTNSLQISQPGMELTGYDINFTNNNIPVLTGTIESTGSIKPFVSKLNSNYQSGCDTVLPISFTLETTTHSFINTTAQPINITEVSTSINSSHFSLTTNTLCNSSEFSLNLGEDITLCPNTSAILKNLDPTIFDTFLWSTGEATASISVNSSGTYWVTATETCTGITLNDTINISIQSFHAPINLTKDTILCLDKSILLDAEHSGESYQWQDGSVDQYFSATIPGQYSVIITYKGCSKTFHTKVTGCEEYIIPNVFTPNGDGKNDLFQILYNGDQEYLLSIYNRWGKQVFKSNDKTHHWNGKTNGNQVSAGNYYYIFSLGDQLIKGHLSLLR